MEERIEQIKIDAISAKLLHRRNKWYYDLINKIISALTIIVPLNFLIIQFATQGTTFETLMTVIGWFLTGLMICLSVLSLIIGLSEKITAHSTGMKNNIYIINECNNLLMSKNYSQIDWFFKYVTEIDNQDNELLSNIRESRRKKIYRYALKEFKPSDYSVTCPMCKSSPWKYKKGSCQLCGNTPY